MKDCDECGEKIIQKRLEAMPYTKVCIGCQQERESNGQFRPHKMDVQAKSRCGEVDVTIQTLVRGTT